MKEWEESHEQKVGELESLISNLRKTISRQADKTKGTRLERISETLTFKKQSRGKKFPVKKVVRVKKGYDGKGKGIRKNTPRGTMSLEEKENSLTI